jgi:hypothetical protein
MGRKPINETVETKIETMNVGENNNDMIKVLMAQMEELKKQIQDVNQEKSGLQQLVDTLKNNNNSTKQTVGSKKIKCINLMHNPLNVSTEPDGMGRVFSFQNYGDTQFIKFDFLSDIVSSYPYTMEHGLLYICDKEAVEELGLSDEYKKIYDKETLDKLIYLREETDVDLLIGMEKNLQESIVIKIAQLLNANEKMDFNYLRKIKEETGYDIEQIAKDIKENESKNEE